MVLDEGASKAETNFKIQPEITIHLETSSSVLQLEFCVLHMCMSQWQTLCPKAGKKSLSQ